MNAHKNSSSKQLFIIDGSSFLYRAYYGLRPLHTPQGEAVQAVFSFCRMIKKIINMFNPEYMIIAWDSPGKTTRHGIHAAYKATRDVPPSDLFDQKKHIVEFANAIGLHQIALQGIEADDIMYSYALDWTKQGGNAILISSDKDMGQTVTDNITIFDPFKEIHLNCTTITDKFGFPPEKIAFYFALIGDSSDNIPGVRGVGPATAKKLVVQFDTLNDLYNNLSAVTPLRVRTLLEENRDNAFLSYQLFLLHYHPTTATPESLSFNPTRWREAFPLFRTLGFTSLLTTTEAKQESATSSTDKRTIIESIARFITVTTHEQLDEMMNGIEKSGGFAIDTEGDPALPKDTALVGLSICVEKGVAYYIPFRHKTPTAQLDRDMVLDKLKPFLDSERYIKYLQNTKFDQHLLHKYDIEITGTIFDTMIAARIVGTDWDRVGLKALSVSYLNQPMLSFDEVLATTQCTFFSNVPLDWATVYAAFDAHQTLALAPLLTEKLKKENLESLFYDLEMPFSQVLYRMESRGIFLNSAHLAQLSAKVEAALITIQEKITLLLGPDTPPINLNSPKQVQILLFEQLRLPPQKKSGKGTGYSTDYEVLQKLSSLHPVPGLISEFRELYKLKSTYIDTLPTFISPFDHKIHTSYNQVSVATGRLASSNPNLQNIPGDGSEFGKEIRAAFIPAPGHQFVTADYSQVELRILAHLSSDHALQKAFLHNKDIHAETAAGIFGISASEISSEQRQLGKRINFSILYGLTPFGLSQDLNIPLKDAKQYIESFFAQYPAVQPWMDSIIVGAKERGYITTLRGRRRYIPAIYETNKVLFNEAVRVAINSVVQGSAADIMKEGMIAVDDHFRNNNPATELLLQIHDELLITTPTEQIETTRTTVTKILESVVTWKIPLTVTTRTGNNWAEASK